MSKHQPDSPRQKWRFPKNKNAAATVSGQLQQLGMEKQIGGNIFCFLNLLLPGRGLGGLKKKYYCFGFFFFESLTNSASWEELPSRSISPAIPQLHVNRRLWEWATSSELLDIPAHPAILHLFAENKPFDINGVLCCRRKTLWVRPAAIAMSTCAASDYS